MMKVYRINDCDWYMAKSLTEAVKAAMRDSGLPKDEATDEPREVTDRDMDLPYWMGDGTTSTFAEQLAIEVDRDPATARMFATTEY